MSKVRIMVLMLVSLLLVVSFVSSSASGEEVLVYAAFDEPTLRAITDNFTASTGIKVKWVQGGAGELFTRIRAEAGRPGADVFLGGSIIYHSLLAEEGLLAIAEAPNAAAIPAKYKDSEGYWFGWYVAPWGYVINTELLAKELPGVPEPKNWEDILDPVWQGHVLSGHPATCGGGYDFIISQIFRYKRLASLFGFEDTLAAGEKAAWSWFEAFEKNVTVFNTACPETIALVAQGQGVVGLSWANDILVWIQKGYPIKLIVPPDCPYAAGGLSMIKGGPNPGTAAEFVNFVLSPESQAINAKAYRWPLNAEVSPPEGAPSWESFTPVMYDLKWAGTNKDRLLDEWEKRIGR